MKKKLQTIVLQGDNDAVQMDAGKFRVSKHANANAIRLVIKGKISKAAGDAALTDAQRQTLLSAFDVSLAYGAQQQHTPLVNVTFARLQSLARALGGADAKAYADATVGKGLAQVFTAAGADFRIALRIPLCLLSQLADGASNSGGVGYFGMGPTQAKTVSLAFRRLDVAAKLPANFALVGSVTVDIAPDEHASRYDRWCIVPRWHQWREDDRIAEFNGLAGLPLLVVERSAAHAASLLSDVGVRVDDLELMDKVSVQDGTAHLDELPALVAAADVRDRETVLYTVTPGARLQSLPTGQPRVEQYAHTLAPMLPGIYYVPLMSTAQVAADVKACAQAKGVTVNAVSLATVLGIDCPSNLVPFLGWALFEAGSEEFERHPGLKCGPTESDSPVPFYPPTVTARARNMVKAHESAGEFAASEAVLRAAARSIPGAVQSARGFKGRGSSVVETTRRVVRG